MFALIYIPLFYLMTEFFKDYFRLAEREDL